ncbi:hypothetical protein E2C01_018041 [Portunus trituberculatus]|uniref:Uncharacterized protein n=1 Tax=Portunus trituberculatus TaxID=210409 RepID=A0A5B7DV48_PORTR|nr:hypothetical protein [Portunus trituberculatus]
MISQAKFVLEEERRSAAPQRALRHYCLPVSKNVCFIHKAMLNQQSIQNQHRPKIKHSLISLVALTNPAVPYSNAGKEAEVFPGSEGKEDNVMLWTNASFFPRELKIFSKLRIRTAVLCFNSADTDSTSGLSGSSAENT